MNSQCNGVKIHANKPKQIAQKWEEKAANTEDGCERERYLQQAEHWNREERRMVERGNQNPREHGQSRNASRRNQQGFKQNGAGGKIADVWPARPI